MSPWAEFYKSRLDFGYYNYARKRYAPMINELLGAKTYLEEGCGIGTISKILWYNSRYKRGIAPQIVMTDKDKDIIQLACQNVYEGSLPQFVEIYEKNIFSKLEYKPEVVFSHGVLEHFADIQIRVILKKQQNTGNKIVHYVPTNGYDKPSFGDERLLPKEYWIDQFNPTRHQEFNENKDLLLIWE